MLINPNNLLASICRDSFIDFVKEFWDVIVPETPVWNWHIEYLCDELQRMVKRIVDEKPKLYDLVINISPGSTKSTICSVMLPAWIWTVKPSMRSICGSYAYSLAMDLSRKSRMIVQSEKYRLLFPNVVLSEDQNTKGFYANESGGGRIAVGTGGAITGFHAHLIIIDDPIKPASSFSEADLTNANNWMRETLPTRKVDKALAPTILIMQRLHENDPTGEWLSRAKRGDIKHICLPAEIVENEHTVKPASLEKYYVDGLMDPVRLSRKILDDSERMLGDYGYAGQFLQHPVPRGGGDFKIERIEFDTPPGRWVQRVRFWDKAGTKSGGAYTAGVLMGKCRHGYFWILDVKRGQWGSYEREQIIKNTAYADGESTWIGVEQEPGSGGKESAENTIRNLAGFRVFSDRPTGNKEFRADPFAVQVNGGNVRIVKGDWTSEYLNEMMYWPRSKYKDQVDASSAAFAFLHKRKIRIGAL